jgi:hypothetical protein
MSHVQRLVSVVKMAIVIQEYHTEEQRSVGRPLWEKGLNTNIFIKKCFLFTVGSVCGVKRFHFSGKRFAVDEEVETDVQKWLRQQPKDFYAGGFDVFVRRWDKCINAGGE